MYERAIPADLARLWEHPYPGTTDQVRRVRAAVRELLGNSSVADDTVHLLSDSLNLSICSLGPFCGFSVRGSLGFRGRLWCLRGG